MTERIREALEKNLAYVTGREFYAGEIKGMSFQTFRKYVKVTSHSREKRFYYTKEEIIEMLKNEWNLTYDEERDLFYESDYVTAYTCEGRK